MYSLFCWVKTLLCVCVYVCLAGLFVCFLMIIITLCIKFVCFFFFLRNQVTFLALCFFFFLIRIWLLWLCEEERRGVRQSELWEQKNLKFECSIFSKKKMTFYIAKKRKGDDLT